MSSDARSPDSGMDTNRGYDVEDSAGIPEHGEGDQQRTQHSRFDPGHLIVRQEHFPKITEDEFNSSEYRKCNSVGKAVIVANFTDGTQPLDGNDLLKERKGYSTQDYIDLEKNLRELGFTCISNSDKMVYKNLTKREFKELYNKVAREENYRKKDDDHTCVLFVVMSFGRSGLIRCHAEGEEKDHPYVEQKDLQEAFQPQNNPSLALKPKIFIIQTIPEPGTVSDGPDAVGKTSMKKIPREADFLTYTSECFYPVKNNSLFMRAVNNVLEKVKKDENRGMEIQQILISINREFKELRDKRKDKKIPCVTSSLTKQLHLFKPS